jgi:hypothetical protein
MRERIFLNRIYDELGGPISLRPWRLRLLGRRHWKGISAGGKADELAPHLLVQGLWRPSGRRAQDDILWYCPRTSVRDRLLTRLRPLQWRTERLIRPLSGQPPHLREGPSNAL